MSINDPLPNMFSTDSAGNENAYLNSTFGLLGRDKIRAMANRPRKLIRSGPPIDEAQFQPASLDLRLGKEAFRVRASFLPGRNRTVKDCLSALNSEPITLTENGAVLEKGIVYIARIAESLSLLPSISGLANPKSSTGRLDIFTRLIVDGGDKFDEVPLGYNGELWLEISPRSFSVRVREHSRLSQLRFRNRNSQQMEKHNFAVPDEELRRRHKESPLVSGELDVREGLVLHIDLNGGQDRVIGYRAIKNSSVIDVDRASAYAAEDFWEPMRTRSGRLILDPDEFYILASQETLQIPADLAAEMAPIDPAIGEFRVHYAGFFDPGFGMGAQGLPSARAVLEVRSRDVPFLLEHGQPVGRLVFERLGEAPSQLYGAGASSNYQGQGLKLSKHFRPWGER